VRRPEGWKPPPPNTRRDKALQRFLDNLLKSKNKGGKVLYKEEGGTLNKYKKDEIKRLKEQIAIQEKAAGPGSERELKSLNTRLNKMQPSIPIPKKKPPRVTSQSSNKSEYFYDEHGKPTFLTGHGYNMLKTRRKPKQTKKTGSKVISKRGGGMSHVGLYPAEERGEDISRSTGTLSQAKRKRHMNKGGKVYRKLGGKVTNGNDVMKMIYEGDN
jgi:hypothetical protein